MPFATVEKRRAYQREWVKEKRRNLSKEEKDKIRKYDREYKQRKRKEERDRLDK